MKLPAAICVAGRIASGKTSLGTALAERIGCRVASFGTYVRAAAATRGLESSDRVVLQSLGAELLENHGPDWLTQQVLEQANWRPGESVILDGIRHVSVLTSVRRALHPQTAYLVYLRVPLDALNERRGMRLDSVQASEAHSTERQVLEELPQIADLALDGTRSVDDLVQVVMSFLSE